MIGEWTEKGSILLSMWKGKRYVGPRNVFESVYQTGITKVFQTCAAFYEIMI